MLRMVTVAFIINVTTHSSLIGSLVTSEELFTNRC